MSNSSSFLPLMMIFSESAQLVVIIKQHLMHIGKIKRMERKNESEFEYGSFHEPANPGTREPATMDDKKYVKCRKAIDRTCMKNE
jgi:hypothetical protein